MQAERPILLRFLNVLTILNDFIIKTIGFLFLVKYIGKWDFKENNSNKCQVKNVLILESSWKLANGLL